jgi:hypothetical protein
LYSSKPRESLDRPGSIPRWSKDSIPFPFQVSGAISPENVRKTGARVGLREIRGNSLHYVVVAGIRNSLKSSDQRSRARKLLSMERTSLKSVGRPRTSGPCWRSPGIATFLLQRNQRCPRIDLEDASIAFPVGTTVAKRLARRRRSVGGRLSGDNFLSGRRMEAALKFGIVSTNSHSRVPGMETTPGGEHPAWTTTSLPASAWMQPNVSSRSWPGTDRRG